MRTLGVDFGRRRIGLALSDDTGTLARPWRVIAAGATPAASADHVAAIIAEGRARPDDDIDIGAVVVGLPRRLNGDDTDQTGRRGTSRGISPRSPGSACGCRTSG